MKSNKKMKSLQTDLLRAAEAIKTAQKILSSHEGLIPLEMPSLQRFHQRAINQLFTAQGNLSDALNLAQKENL